MLQPTNQPGGICNTVQLFFPELQGMHSLFYSQFTVWLSFPSVLIVGSQLEVVEPVIL